MMYSLRDVQYALDGWSKSWSLRDSIKKGLWPAPALDPAEGISVAELTRRFKGPAEALRAFEAEQGCCWDHVDRATMLGELRYRLRDPGVMRQIHTGFCGPLSIVVELARRAPAHYVRAINDLLVDGEFVVFSGPPIVAEGELREEPLPEQIAQVDWVLAATLRDDANAHFDVDGNANGLEALTMPGAMERWVGDVLGMNWVSEPCQFTGEFTALKGGAEALARGGAAFVLIDSALLEHVDGNIEERVWFRSRPHQAGKPIGSWSGKLHSADDDTGTFDTGSQNHWVILLPGLVREAGAPEDAAAELRLWSWGCDYFVEGTADAISEYIYHVVSGTPPAS